MNGFYRIPIQEVGRILMKHYHEDLTDISYDVKVGMGEFFIEWESAEENLENYYKDTEE